MNHHHDSMGHGGKVLGFSRLQVPPELYASTVFVKWSHEGKEAALFTVQLDTCNHQIKLRSPKEDFVIDIRQLKVLPAPPIYLIFLKLTFDFYLVVFMSHCTCQLVLIGNHPRESSKIKKLLTKCKEVHG